VNGQLALSGACRRQACLAGEIGRSVEEAGQAYREAEAAVEREQAARPFDDFMIWLAGESDRCPRPDREQA